jgi:hypothetical protein
MPNQPQKTFAIKLWQVAFLVASCLLGQAQAEPVGQVINLSGPLFAVKGDGVKRVISVGSAVDTGDTLVTEAKTYARVRFADASEVTLRPESRLTVEGFTFKQNEPAKDNAVFKLFKGAMRTVTGLVGKRGNQDAYKLNTPTATIGIRGTQFIVEYIPDEASGDVARFPHSLPLLAALTIGTEDTLNDVSSGLFDVAPLQLAQSPQPTPASRSGLAPGLYVSVIDGMITLSNAGGSQNFSAGQFGFTASFQQPPVILPSNPGLQFNPPPAFNGPAGLPGPGPTGQNSSPNRPTSGNSVDCVVR